MDKVYEQLITTSKTSFYKIVTGATYAFAIIGIVVFSVNIIFAMILLCTAVACFFYKQKLYVEFEYQFMNGEIKIEKILEMKKRSSVTTFNIQQVGLLAPEDSDAVKDYDNKPNAIVKCYPTTARSKVYVAMVTEGNDRMQLRFMPDERFLEDCFKYNPRVVKR